MVKEGHRCGFGCTERLRGKRSLDGLFEAGQSGFIYPFRYIWTVDSSRESDAPVAVLISAPKRNHKRANRRNLLKRRTREAYRLNKNPLLERMNMRGGTMNLALIYSSREVEDYSIIEDAVKKIISRLTAGL